MDSMCSKKDLHCCKSSCRFVSDGFEHRGFGPDEPAVLNHDRALLDPLLDLVELPVAPAWSKPMRFRMLQCLL